MKKKAINVRLCSTAYENLEAYMTAHKLTKTQALEAILLATDTEALPVDHPMYHAEISKDGDRVKCPIGPYKNQWVTMAICRKCKETQCDLRR